MDPTKPEAVSKQSSILKPTKQRQPLQCVTPGPGSSESSPTIKIKRRVSFARNKRIREFCNEAEPGAVLDDTYEEHDSSSAKSNSTSGNEPLTITIPCHDKENFPVQLFLQTDEIECKEIPLNVANEDGDMSQCDMEIDNTLNPDIQIKDMENATIYCDDGMDITTYVPSRIIACHNQDTNFLDEKEAIEITENILLPCKNSTAHQNNKSDLLKNNAANSTDLTVAISQLLGAGHANKQSSNLSKCPNLSYNCENTAPMEFTSVIPSSTWIRSNSTCNSDKRTENFDNPTMEFTMAVAQANICENKNTENIGSLSDKTKIYTNKSMEMTETISVQNMIQASAKQLENKTKVFTNKLLEMTETIPAHIENCKEIQNKIQYEYMQDKTEFFANKSIEITEAIPAYIENCKQTQRKKLLQSDEDRTKYFTNKAMEMTEAIPVYIEECHQSSRKTSSKVGEDRSKIFNNKSMEMTEVITSNNKKNNLQEKTNIFLDKSMEMTEAIPIYIEECHQASRKTSSKPGEDRTKIFNNKSMEMTEVITSNNKKNNLQEKTNIFLDKSMEMTEAIPIYIEECHQVSRKTSSKPGEDRTKIFTDKSMEITEVITSNNKKDNLQEKTNIFLDKSMEMTEAITSNNKKDNLQEKTNIFLDKSMEMTEVITSNNKKDNLQEKSNIFLDKSMEMTEAVPTYNIIQRKYPDIQRTPENTFFADKSIEITETIPLFYKFHHSNYGNKPNELDEDKTNICDNKSMEMTEVIPSYKSPKSQANAEKTNIFANASMEMTETVPIQNIHQYNKTVPQEENKCILNESMEITEAVSNSKLANQIPVYSTEYEQSSNTKKIQYKSLPKSKSVYSKPTEITQSLASLMTKDPAILRELFSKQTEFFSNESMNMTETIPVTHNVSLDEDKTKFFANKSMEITEAIPGHVDELELDNSKNPEQEKTKIFSDKSMNMTETIILSSCLSSEQGKNITHGGPHFMSNDQSLMSRVSTIPNINSNLNHLKSCENILNNQLNINTIQIHRDDSMEMTIGLPTLSFTKTAQSILNKENSKVGNLIEAVSDNSNIFNVSKSKIENKSNVSTKLTDQEQPYDSTKIFHNTSMEFTALPPTESSAANMSKKDLSYNQSILSTKMNSIQNSVNVSNFESFRDDFHRITSDELNTLCASMNLPIQKYSSENISIQNSSIPACSNVNILRESLRKGTLFQQPSILLTQNASVQTPAKNYATVEGKNNSKPYSDTDFNMRSYKDLTKTMDVSEVHSNLTNKFAIDQNNFNTSKPNILSFSTNSPLVEMEVDKTIETSLRRMPLTEMGIDKTMEVSLKNTERTQLPSISMEVDKTAEINPKSVQSSSSKHAFLAQTNPLVYSCATSIQEINKSHSIMNVSVAKDCLASTAVAEHNSLKITDQITKNLCTEKETFTAIEAKSTQTYTKHMVNEKPSKIEINHDVLMEKCAPSAKPSGKRKSDETYETVNKRNPALFPASIVYTYTQTTENSNKNSMNPDENSLSKLPSDNTEVLLATMGFQTEFAYPLIINDKTVIKVSHKPLIDKTFVINENPSIENQVETNKSQVEINKTYVVAENADVQIKIDKSQIEPNKTDVIKNNKNHNETNKTYVIEDNKNQVEMENVINNGVLNNENDIPCVGIPFVKSPGNRNPTNIDEDVFDDDKENQEPSVKVNLFAEKYSQLEEIQPPSFLCSDSISQEDDLSDIVKLPNDDPDSPIEKEIENVIVPFAELENIHFTANEFDAKQVFAEKIKSRPESNVLSENIIKMRNRRKELLEQLKILSKEDTDSTSEKVKENRTRKEIRESNKNNIDSQKLPSSKKENVEDVNENVVKEPLSPFLQLTEDIKTIEKRDDCIWSVRRIDTELITIDFISKSLVLVIRLKDIENIVCIRNIEKIEVISRLQVKSKNMLLKITHNLLLSKLNTKEMLDKYKLYEDILPLLEFVSNEVIFAMKFMFDLKKLNALNLSNINEKRITFMVTSRKANVILKVTLALKAFEELSPDDVDVVCVLGDIRVNDIKQLIVNIKKDYKFLSRYIKDIKDYITLMEESTSLYKF